MGNCCSRMRKGVGERWTDGRIRLTEKGSKRMLYSSTYLRSLQPVQANVPCAELRSTAAPHANAA